MALDKDGLFAKIEQDKNNKKIIKVHVDDWGDDVFIRQLDAGERSQIESNYVNAKPKTFQYFRVHLVCACLCDEHGVSLLACNRENFDKLAQGGAKPIDQIFDYVLELNGMRKEDIEEAEEIFLMKTD